MEHLESGPVQILKSNWNQIDFKIWTGRNFFKFRKIRNSKSNLGQIWHQFDIKIWCQFEVKFDVKLTSNGKI